MCIRSTILASFSSGTRSHNHHHSPGLWHIITYRDNIARSARIKDRLLKTILSWIQRERTGEVINRGLLKNITQMLVDLGVNSRTVYEDDFERHFLETSATFYRLESQEFISSNSASDYMRKVRLFILRFCFFIYFNFWDTLLFLFSFSFYQLLIYDFSYLNAFLFNRKLIDLRF